MAEKFSWEFPGKGRVAGTMEGDGKRVVLCFHGYGADHRQFDPLLGPAPPGWRVLRFDMPFFGKSEWVPGAVADDAFLDAFLGRIQLEAPHDTLYLVGYSMGARFALGLAARLEAGLAAGILLAPDGLRTHPLYRLCVGSMSGRWLFRTCMRHPGLMLRMMRTLHYLKLIGTRKYRFAMRFLGSKARRTQLLHAWTGYRRVRPGPKAIAEVTRKTGAVWHVIWGKDDGILPPATGNRFRDAVPNTTLYLVDEGHALLRDPPEALRTMVESMLEWR